MLQEMQKSHGMAASQLGQNDPRELGIIERGAGVVSGLQMLHEKLSAFQSRIEGNGKNTGGQATSMPSGLCSQLSESEGVLRACHSLLDDINSKF